MITPDYVDAGISWLKVTDQLVCAVNVDGGLVAVKALVVLLGSAGITVFLLQPLQFVLRAFGLFALIDRQQQPRFS